MRTIYLLCSLYCLLQVGTLSAQEEKSTTVCIQPLGEYRSDYVPYLERGIAYVYGFQTKVLPQIAMPAEAYYAERRRYRAVEVVTFLEVVKSVECDLLLGFTALDISITKKGVHDFGIMGWANGFGNGVALVSTYRMPSMPQIDVRKLAVKTSNHEIGHMLGFKHHPREACLMSEWKTSLDHESVTLCDDTRFFIESRYHLKLPVHEVFEWSVILD